MSLFSDADKQYLLKILEAAPTKRPIESISDWIEGRRILPTSTPLPGPWRNSVVPYGREIMDSLAPNSGIQRVTVMKCRKVGMTTIMENVIAYYILENPSEILYATASEDLAQDWGDHKIMTVLETLGGLDRITASTTNAKSRRTGNTSSMKEYIGGKLDIMSSNSKRARRQLDKRVLIVDELDGVEAVTTTGEGKFTEVLFGHVISWGVKQKIALFGSPTVFETSLTNEYYQQGDCRRFMVPCPYCGELIELRLNVDSGASFGLKAETEAGEIIGAYYQCEHCGEAIRNEQKLEMYSDNPRCLKRPEKEIEKYRWEPTRKPDDPAWRSYHLNALYSPIGMLTFTDVAKARAKAEAGDHVDMRSYVNIYQGLPFKDAGSRPKIENVINLRGGYKSGTVPKDVLFLTMAVDVQEGSKKDESNPPRLELEVLGHGLGYRTWSILYKSILGETDDPFAGAWAELDEWGKETGLQFIRDDGVLLKVQIIFIDSGDQAETVYQFCGEWINTFPSKGFGFIKADEKRKEKGDIPGAGNYRRWREAKFGSNTVYEISTNYYKTLLYNRLKIERQPSDPQKPGYCDFPRDYGEDYFKMLTAEEKRTDGSFHKVHNRNEALDVRVYNLCAADIWLAAQVQNWRLYFQAQGASAMQILQVNSRFVLERLEKNPNIVLPKL